MELAIEFWDLTCTGESVGAVVLVMKYSSSYVSGRSVASSSQSGAEKKNTVEPLDPEAMPPVVGVTEKEPRAGGEFTTINMLAETGLEGVMKAVRVKV